MSADIVPMHGRAPVPPVMHTAPRWQAVISYSFEFHTSVKVHQFEELSELHGLVEHGPDWNCITSFHVQLNPLRRHAPRREREGTPGEEEA